MKRPINAIIEDVIVDSEKVQPIIVNFQNGELKDDEAKKMSCGLFYDQQKKKRTLALSNGQIVYKGYKPDTSQDLMRTMLVLHNKNTGRVRLIQAERWQVTPVLEKPVTSDSEVTTDKKISMLNKQFGSKKVKRRTELLEKLKVNVESVKEELEQTVIDVEIDRTDLTTKVSDSDCIANIPLPKCNRDANDVKDVYNVYDIIPQDKLETLYDTAAEVLKEESDSSQGTTKFFNRTLKYLRTDPDNIKKVALLIYMQAVANWLNMPIKNAKKQGIDVCEASQDVNSHIINTYSIQSTNGRLRPASIKDKGVIHCMILALTICNFMVDIELFATLFSHRMGLRKLTDLAKIVGASLNKEDKKMITLKVPLPQPAVLIKRSKKK